MGADAWVLCDMCLCHVVFRSEEREEAIFKELEMTDCIKEKVVPHAVLFFTGDAAAMEGMMEEEDDMNEDGM
jgi:hypothetical protein